MVVKRPSSGDQMWGTYTKEFSGHVWAVLGSTAAALVLALHGTTAIMEQGTERLSLLESFNVVMGALCGQGCSTPPRTAPARLVLLTTLVLHVVIQAHYTSNLASSLAVGPLMPSFSTIRGILAEPGLSFGLMRETAMVEYLKVSRCTKAQFNSILFLLVFYVRARDTAKRKGSLKVTLPKERSK
ncbi:hypothetical protein E2C01_073116 [Portunus trituberculatus]|uniref:Ionotropic glutamate receptor C-terminal domain-containing protein n=1 Tax=Portunus trituberculatus TaxID=210409 RepID=A0A5B7ID68_PORTR|nr:hypothetical protein [Portunus trituberculatus]